MTLPRLALVSAIDEELRALQALLQATDTRVVAGRCFHLGELHGRRVVLVRSGIGKVAAATTAALLLDRFACTAIVFTGVAGGLAAGVAVGDVVVGACLLQHDMDASPLFPRHEVPLTGRSRFDADPALTDSLAAAAGRCLGRAGGAGPGTRADGSTATGTRAAGQPGADADADDGSIDAAALSAFGIVRPTVHRGLILSGDQFVSSAAHSQALRERLPDALAVEMEGAAVAQVCADFGAPFAVLRTVSDRADDSAHVDFPRFIASVASAYTRAIVVDWLRHAPRS